MSRTARRWVLILCLALVVIGALAAVVVLLGGVTVPDVTGKTQADATEALEDAGLEVGTIAQTSDAEAAAGTVLLQDPAAGTEVDEGSVVAPTSSA
jgi:serine/threonine-protein kinase